MDFRAAVGGFCVHSATQCALGIPHRLLPSAARCRGECHGLPLDVRSLSNSSGLYSSRTSSQTLQLHSECLLTRRSVIVPPSSTSQVSSRVDGYGQRMKSEGFYHPIGNHRNPVSGISLNKGIGCFGLGDTAQQGSPSQKFETRAYRGSAVGDLEWMSRATPYEVLGVSEDCGEEEIKSAFRARIKEYHPDVYQGFGDADAITQRILRAYEILTNDVERQTYKRRSLDPFEEPECFAEDLFVNEVACIGRGCPYSCVERAPDVFQFASDTGCARAVKQGLGGEYHVQLAVGQCPRNCIHYLTPQQRIIVEELLQSAFQGTVYSFDTVTMEGLIAKANYENGRYQPPKRKAKRTEQWVDWF